MAAVTGPISSLPGRSHDVPDGQMCDEHPDRPAVARIQGETDSFGCEMEDICQQCADERKAYRCSEAGQAEELEWRTGACQWCRNHVTDLRDARDYDEGLSGRVYRVCGACIKRVNDEAAAELDAFESFDFRDEEDDDFCQGCYDVGEVYGSDDADWRGYCTCAAGLRLKGEAEARYRAKSQKCVSPPSNTDKPPTPL